MTPKNLIIYLNCEKFRQMATLTATLCKEDEKEGNNTSRLTWSETKEDCRFVCARTVNKSQAIVYEQLTHFVPHYWVANLDIGLLRGKADRHDKLQEDIPV